MEKVQLECPVCHRVFEVDALFAGMNCRCPVCRCELTSPMCGDDREIRRKLTIYYKLYLWFSIISLAVSVIGTWAMGMLLARQYALDHSGPPTADMLKTAVSLILIFLAVAPMAVTALVFKCILLYRLWKLVPPEQAATTPGKAVGFMFIPFFNRYWNFVAFFKLGIFLEKRSGSALPRQLSLNFSIILIVGLVADLFFSGADILFQLAASIVEIVMMASFMNAVRRWRNWE